MGAPEQKLILRMTPVVNGGWIVEQELPEPEGCYQVQAAVSSAADLVKWLAGHLEVDLAAFDVRVEYSGAHDVVPLAGDIVAADGEFAIRATDPTTCPNCWAIGTLRKVQGRRNRFKCRVCSFIGLVGPEGGDA